MAKQYTQAQWARIQSRLPEEDRVPYSQSPDKFDTAADVAARTQGFAQRIEPGVTPDQFPSSVTTPRTSAATPTAVTPTPTPTPTPISTPTQKATQQLPSGFTAGPFPKELEQFFGPAGDILGYKINTFTDKNGKTYYTLSVAQKGAYGEGITGYSTFGARFTSGPNGGYVTYTGDGGGDSDGQGTQSTSSAFAAQQAAAEAAEEKRRAGQSAYSLLFEQFQQYGLGALVEPLKQFIVEGLSPAEFTLRLRDTDAYKKRFAANQSRIQRGLRALSEAEYIELEDQYQNVMRNYGLPASYYTRGDMGRQEGFEKFIAGDVSAAELEDRIVTAQNRVINAAPEVSRALREFYPDITNGDILAYTLDPDQALSNIKRKVTAAEIGAGALQAGLATGAARAEELGRYGVTGEQARQGFQTIADILPRGSQLAEIYKQSPYSQTVAEQEVFGLAGAAEAAKQRKKLTQLETAAFSGTSGAAGGALGRERAGAF